MPLAALPLAITLVVAPAQLKMETNAPAATVTVTAPGARHLRLWCSTGEVSAPEVLGGGRFAARYLPPSTGKPTYAVLAAWDEATGEAAAATVALAARTEIPVETDAGAQVVALVHGRRSTARANAAGHARVPAWVWPGERSATVTAVDAAGNATSSDVALELSPPDHVFLLAPAELAAGAPARIYAFATGGATPKLEAAGGRLDAVDARAGVVSAQLRAGAGSADGAVVTVTASAGGDRVSQRVRVAAVTPPPARSIALTPPSPSAPPPSTTPPPTAVVPPVAPPAPPPAPPPLSPWELGVSASARWAGDFVGGGGAVTLRRTLGRASAATRFAIGVDVDGRYAAGTLGGDDATLAGAGARLVGELRLRVHAGVDLFAAVDAGGELARVHRTPAVGAAHDGSYGGPLVGGELGVLARLGPGRLVIAAGYAWTPLVAAGLANVDGVALTVGYRFARWRRRRRGRAWRRRARRRRADGTRCARPRRPEART